MSEPERTLERLELQKFMTEVAKLYAENNAYLRRYRAFQSAMEMELLRQVGQLGGQAKASLISDQRTDWGWTLTLFLQVPNGSTNVEVHMEQTGTDTYDLINEDNHEESGTFTDGAEGFRCVLQWAVQRVVKLQEELAGGQPVGFRDATQLLN